MSEYNRHKFAMEWMNGGGRDPNGRSLDDEIKIGKEDWMERQRVAQGGRIGLQSGQLVQPGPEGVRQGYGAKKSDLPTFVYKTKNKENIDYVSVKKPLKNIEGSPIVLGTFTFKKIEYFINSDTNDISVLMNELSKNKKIK